MDAQIANAAMHRTQNMVRQIVICVGLIGFASQQRRTDMGHNEEVWIAEWVDNDKSEEMMCKCSKCGYPVSYFWGKTAFCPGCGRAMTPEAWSVLEKRLRG